MGFFSPRGRLGLDLANACASRVEAEKDFKSDLLLTNGPLMLIKMWVHSFILLKADQVSTFTLHALIMEHVTLCLYLNISY